MFFLLFVFVYVFFCMYMYGGSIFPYAFFLCANALMTVCANGIFDPTNAWHIGLGRVLEILTGVVSILIVANLVLPRFAPARFHSVWPVQRWSMWRTLSTCNTEVWRVGPTFGTTPERPQLPSASRV